MADCLHDLNLAQDPLPIVLFLDCVFVYDFHCNLLICQNVDGLLYLPESTFT